MKVILKISTYYLFIFIFLFTPALYSQTNKSDLAKKLYNEGVQFFNQGKNKQALYKFKKVKKYLPDDPAPYRKIAQIYVREKNYKLSLNHFKKVIELLIRHKQNNLLPYLYRDIADIYFNMKDYYKALDYYKLALHKIEQTEDTSFAGILYIKIAMVEYNKKNYNQSEINLIKALKINQKEKISSNLAKNHYELSKTYLKQNNFKNATIEIDKAIYIYHDLQDPQGLGLSYLHKGDILYEKSLPSEGFSYYKKGLDILKSIGAYHDLTIAYYRLGNFFLTQHSYSKAEFSFKLGIKAGYDQIYIAELSKCFDNYIMLLRRANKDEEIFIELYRHYFYALKHHKKLKINNLNTVLEIEKKTFDLNKYSTSQRRNLILLFHDIAGIYFKRNQYKIAENFYQDAIDIAIKSKEDKILSQLYFKMGRIFYEIKNIKKTSHYYNLALNYSDQEKTPFLSQLYTGLGHIHKDEKKYKEAFVYYKKAFALSNELSLNNRIPINHIHLGKIYFLQNKMKDCIYHYVAAYELTFDYDIEIRSILYNNFAEFYLSQNELKKAEVFLSEALNFQDDNLNSLELGNTYYFLGILHKKKKEFDIAEKNFIHAKKIFMQFDIEELNKVNLELKKLAEEKLNQSKDLQILLDTNP